MNHLDIIKEAYDKCGISYVVRTNGTWSYVFLAGNNRKRLETEDINVLCRTESFMEFNRGEIASY